MKIVTGVGLIVMVAMFGMISPAVVLVSSGQNISSINFKDDFSQLEQKVHDYKQAKIRTFSSVFGADGKVEKYVIKAEVADGQGCLLYNITYHPNMALYIVKKSKVAVGSLSMPADQIGLDMLSRALSHINFTEALKVRKSLRCNVIIGSKHAETKPYNNPDVESYVVDGDTVEKIDREKQYPESCQFLVIDESGVLAAYYVI